MSLPSNMFVAGDIIQTILRTFFLGHPVLFKLPRNTLETFLKYTGGMLLGQCGGMLLGQCGGV